LYSRVEKKVNGRRHPLRKWRLRGRRGQVAAVATILGLLLVVTYLANYLTTTLPGQMSVNDLQHDVQVENQVGRLQALIAAGVASDAVGAQLSQPITLGGAGQPPFAGADSGWISPGNLSGSFKANFTAASSQTIGITLDGAAGTGACTGAPSVRCPSGTWFTTSVSPSVASDLLVLTLNVYEESAALTTADVTDSSGSTWHLVNAGGNADGGGACGGGNFCEYVFWALDPSAGADTVSVGAAGLTAHDTSAVLLAFLGILTSGPISAAGAFATAGSTTASATVAAPATGLVLGLVTSALTGSSAFPTITADSAVTPCTSPCTAIASEDGENWGVTFADSEAAASAGTYTASATLSNSENWGEIALAIAPAPVVTPPTLTPLATGAPPPGAALVVHLRNTYVPTAEIAYDQGAVVFAQPGSVPTFVDPPAFTYSGSSVSVTIPVFRGTIPVESGFGTTDVLVRLINLNTFDFPGNGLFVEGGSDISLSLQSPYWAAWMGYFDSNPNFAGFVTCTVAGAACPPLVSAFYEPGGPLGTITLSLPATSLDLTVATFAITLT
jgi:hypothetical protein